MEASRIHPLWLVVCLLPFSACGKHSFRVVPKTPAYVLRTPDSRELPLNEVLRAYNGFVRGQGSIELTPLMELRIENAYYLKGASRRGLAGFLGTEIAFYGITAEGLRLISTRPMQNRPADDLSVEGLISPQSMHFRFYRLYYEIVFAHSGNSHGSVLLGANTRDELARLSDQLVQPETVCSASSTHCTVFPEACSVSVEMEIVVNGKPQNVVWGSTLEGVVRLHPVGLAVKRLYRGRLVLVKIDSSDPEALGLPLLPGDRIDWK